MNGPRRHFGTDQKAAILKRYLVDKVPISDLCDEYGIKPNQIYAWQKILIEQDEPTILQRAREKFPNERPRIIGDNGSQFLAKDFKEFIRIRGMTHVRTSPCYPQGNGKLERFHGSIKGECLRPGTGCERGSGGGDAAAHRPRLQHQSEKSKHYQPTSTPGRSY